MADDFSSAKIIATTGGRKRRLSTEKQWRAAIERQDITRDTIVDYEAGPGRKATMPAGECPPLIGLFDEIIGPAPEPVAPPPPPPPPPPPASPAAPTPSPTAAASPPAPERTSEPVEEIPRFMGQENEPTQPPIQDTPEPRRAAPEEPVQAAPPKDRSRWVPVGIAVGIVAIGFFAMSQMGDDDGSGFIPPEDGSGGLTNVPEPLDELAAESGEPYFTRRSIALLDSPSGGAGEIGSLSRGDYVEVLPVDGAPDWARIAGQQAYIQRSALTQDTPPSLDSSTFDDYYTLEPATIYSAPSYGGAVIDTIPISTLTTVSGTVGGDFAEIPLDDGGVGYVPWIHFGGVGGEGRRAELRVVNYCNVTKNIAFSLVVNGQRMNGNGAWTFNPGHDNAIAFSNSRDPIIVNGSELYYADIGDNWHREVNRPVSGVGVDQVRVGRDLREMSRVVPQVDSSGNYRISFCD